MTTDDLIGLPYERGARGPHAFDCWGLVLELARRAGQAVPADWDSHDMPRSVQRALMASEAPARTVQLAGPQEGAIALSRRAAHCGYVLHGRVIHAQRGVGVVAWPAGVWTLAFPDGSFHAWRA